MKFFKRLHNKKNSNKKAFSLVEAIVSLMLLTLVVTLTLASVTKKRAPIPKKDPGGMFACWQEGDKTYAAEYAGQSLVYKKQTTTDHECEFEMSRRVVRYYVATFGSRHCKNSECVDGQMIMERKGTPGGDNDEELKYVAKIGKKDQSNIQGNTSFIAKNLLPSISGKDKVDASAAMGGIEKDDTGIAPNNIYRCALNSILYKKEEPSKLLCNLGAYCSVESKLNGSPPDYTYSTTVTITCNIEDTTSGDKYTEEYTADLERDFVPDGDHMFKIKDTENHDFTYHDKTDPTDVKTIHEQTPDGKTVGIVIQEKDPMLKTEESNDVNESKFIKFLKMLPGEYRTDLTKKLYKSYSAQANLGQDGVVLILW